MPGSRTCSAWSSWARSVSRSGNSSVSQTSPGVSRWMPEACASSRRSVTPSRDASETCVPSEVVKGQVALLLEHQDRARDERLRDRGDRVLACPGVASRPLSTSASPTDSLHSSSSAAGRARRSRSAPGSRAGTGSARAAARRRVTQAPTRAPSARGIASSASLDVLVLDPEVGGGPQHARPHDRHEHALLADARASLGRCPSRPGRGCRRSSSRLRPRSTGIPASARPSASRRARAWSSARRSTWWSSAYSAAAATTPACRIAPPNRNFSRQARSIRSSEEARTAPSGQPSPLEKQMVTLSASRPYSAAGIPLAAAAFMIRAPSRCTASPSSRAAAADAASSS